MKLIVSALDLSIPKYVQKRKSCFMFYNLLTCKKHQFKTVILTVPCKARCADIWHSVRLSSIRSTQFWHSAFKNHKKTHRSSIPEWGSHQWSDINFFHLTCGGKRISYTRSAWADSQFWGITKLSWGIVTLEAVWWSQTSGLFILGTLQGCKNLSCLNPN